MDSHNTCFCIVFIIWKGVDLVALCLPKASIMVEAQGNKKSDNIDMHTGILWSLTLFLTSMVVEVFDMLDE